jgi:hypothetical protein
MDLNGKSTLVYEDYEQLFNYSELLTDSDCTYCTKRVFGIKILMNSHMSFFVANAGHAAELEYL